MEWIEKDMVTKLGGLEKRLTNKLNCPGLTVANQECGREEDGVNDIVAPLVSTMGKVMRPRLNSWKGEHWDIYLEKCT